MKIKLWMTNDSDDDIYEFWRDMPEPYGPFWGGGADDNDCAFATLRSEIPEHLRFEEGGAKAIRLVELDITINGVEEAGK